MTNRVHETAILGPDVELGERNVIGPYTVILGPCEIGDDNWIGPHVAIGTPGEMRGGAHPAAWDGDEGVGPTIIGNRNVIREFATVQQGFVDSTRIADDCYVMTKAHVPHDGVLGRGVTVSCSAMIGGHSVLGEGANVGLGAVVHQHLAIGAGAMVGMGSVVTKDVPPFAMAYGSPARVRGGNVIGLGRAGFADDVVAAVDVALRDGDDISELLPEQSRRFAEEVELSRRVHG